MKLLKTTPLPAFILGILALFILKGVFLSVFIPFFQNPDEPVHYGTIQHWAEPEEKTWEITRYKRGEYSIDFENTLTSNLPQETREGAVLMGFDEIKSQNQNTQDFDDITTENLISTNTWTRFVDTTPSAVSGTRSFYYSISAGIERGLADQDIFTRMLAIRLFSVLLGLLTVGLAYLTLLKIGFSRIQSTLITALIALQPMLGVTAAQINIDIALIFSFALLTYAAVSLLRGIDSSTSVGMTKWIILAIIAALLGFFAKGPGIVLVAALFPLFAYALWNRFGQSLLERCSAFGMTPRTLWLSLALFVITLGIVLAALVPASYWSSITHAGSVSQFDSPLASLSAYLDKTIDTDAFRWSALSYWGNFGWLDTSIGDNVFDIIWTIEIIALIGLLFYLIPARSLDFARNDKHRTARFFRELGITDEKEFLPQKKYIVFLLLLSLALQFAIRFYDWRVFDATAKILIGTPGRYFLPSIIAHFALLATGLGFFCRSKARFHQLLKTLLVCMLLLQLYAMFSVILPRYYL